MISTSEQVARLVTIDAGPAAHDRILEMLAQSRALLNGHFALQRGRHSTTALRFRGIGREAASARVVVEALLERAPDDVGQALLGAKILTPESSGFFFGRALATRNGTSHVVAQTDLRRLPTKILLSGTIKPNDRVMLANDVASTGASLDALRALVAERGGLAVGVILFAVVGSAPVTEYCAKWKLPSHWLVTARWNTHPTEACPGCHAGEPLTPVAEFA